MREPRRQLDRNTRPLERFDLASAGALIFFTAVALAGRHAIPDLGVVLATYAVLAAIMAAAIAAAARWPASGLLDLLRNFYPTLFFPILFDSLSMVTQYVNPRDRDAALAAADLAIFGAHPTVWLERFIHPLLSDLAYASYASYYLLPLILGLAIYFKLPRHELRRYVFALAFTFYISYAGYLAVPAIGPRYFLAAEQTRTLAVGPIGETIRDTIDEFERNKRDCFPSGHTMVTLVVMIYSWKLARRLFWIFLFPAGMLLFATVYCRYHYVTDVLAGVVLAIACYAFAEWSARRDDRT